ncbi:hypothetical protein ACXM2N_03495 [Corynebacterium sp. ZY180755]
MELNDVQKLLPNRQIPPEDEAFINALIDEAWDLVCAYCRSNFPNGAPDKIKRVVTRMVARAYSSEMGGGDAIPDGASNVSYTAGPFSRSVGFESGSTSSGVWLSSNDKQRLRGYRSKVFTIYPY